MSDRGCDSQRVPRHKSAQICFFRDRAPLHTPLPTSDARSTATHGSWRSDRGPATARSSLPHTQTQHCTVTYRHARECTLTRLLASLLTLRAFRPRNEKGKAPKHSDAHVPTSAHAHSLTPTAPVGFFDSGLALPLLTRTQMRPGAMAPGRRSRGQTARSPPRAIYARRLSRRPLSLPSSLSSSLCAGVALSAAPWPH